MPYYIPMLFGRALSSSKKPTVNIIYYDHNGTIVKVIKQRDGVEPIIITFKTPKTLDKSQ